MKRCVFWRSWSRNVFRPKCFMGALESRGLRMRELQSLFQQTFLDTCKYAWSVARQSRDVKAL